VRPLVALLMVVSVCGCTSSPTASSEPRQATITVGARAGTPAAGAGSVWVPNTGDGTVSRIDPSSNRVIASIKIGEATSFYHDVCEPYGSVHSFMVTTFNVRRCDLPSAVAAGARSVWAAKNDTNAIVQIDPASNRIVKTVPIQVVPFSMLVTDDAVWITSYEDDAIVRVDPAGASVAAVIRRPGQGPTGLASSSGFLWVANSRGASVSRINPKTNAVDQTVPITCPSTCLAGPEPLAIASTSQAIWVRNVGNGTLARIDTDTIRVSALIDVESFYGRDGQDAIGVTSSAVWLSGISLERVDPESNRVARIPTEGGITLTVGFDSLWVTDTVGHIVRLDPRRLKPS
jgi:virginiamycin B lyase